MSSSDRKQGASRKHEVPNEPKETNSIIFEWPLRGLKEIFDSSKTDAKSKVIKSTPFGGGRWTVLFYAQSGHDQFCSLYLNAEPLPHERIHPLLGNASPPVDNIRGSAVGSSRSKNETGLEDKWARKGLFRFTFNIQVIEDRTVLGNKEAYDHAFSHKTSNWGWAQFAKRDAVYYKNPDVIREDGLLITVTITSSPEKPKLAEPISLTVPPVLVQAMGSLLDDPEHSDVVFHLHPSRHRSKKGRTAVRKVYAIRKILAARSDYFRLMFEGGFSEAEAEESSEDEDNGYQVSRSDGASNQQLSSHPSRTQHSAAHTDSMGKHDLRHGYAAESPSHAGYAAESPSHAGYAVDEDESSNEDYEDGQNPMFDDSDADYDDQYLSNVSPYRTDVHTPAESGQRDYMGSGYNSPNEDEDPGSSQLMAMRLHEDAFKCLEDDRSKHDIVKGNSQKSDLDMEEELRKGSANPSSDDRQSEGPYIDEETSSMQGAGAIERKRPSVVSNNKSASSSSSKIAVTNSNEIPPRSGQVSKRSRSRTSDAPIGTQNQVSEKRQEHDRRKRRKVNVVDSAYPTFKALLYFLYTDTIDFAPLTSSFLPADIAADDVSMNGGSMNIYGESALGRRGRDEVGSLVEEMAKAQRKRKAVIEAYCERNPGKPSPCSAKAMYRLADKLDIPDLKRRAQEHIAMSLTVYNIVWETFSGYNTQFPDICDMEIDFLLKHWSQVKRSNAMKSIFQQSNNLPGSSFVLPKLLERLDYRPPDVDETEEVYN